MGTPGSITILPDGGKIIKTNCFECHAKCGVLSHVNKDGILVKVKGNPEDPRSEGRMCSKGLSATRILYDPERTRYPMKRVGERGSGKWERISWDEALDTIEAKIRSYTEEYGPGAVAYGQGTGRGTNQWTYRMSNANGVVRHLLAPGYLCLLPMMLNSFAQQGAFALFDGCDFDHADCIVSWGSNFVWTEGTFTSGQIGRSRDRGAKMIVIDPFFEHPLAAKADVFVGVRPGSDNALAMAWIRLIISEGWYDEEFTKKYTNMPMLIYSDSKLPVMENQIRAGGSDKTYLCRDLISGEFKDVRAKGIDEDLEFEGEIELADGTKAKVRTVWVETKELVEPYTPQHAAEICWVEPDTIIESCRVYATAKSATICMLQGIELQSHCKDTIQMINIIIAITGNLEKKGGNLSRPFWPGMRPLGGATPPNQTENRLRINDVPLLDHSEPQACWEAMLTGKPYPIKMYLMVQGNPLSWGENTKRIREALMSLEFIVVMDYYFSPTAQIADIVLPSAHWTERDYIADEVCVDWLFCQQRSVDPLYERWSDITFWRVLGNRISPDWWPFKSDEELFDWQLKELGTGITWKELQDKWIHELPPQSTREYWKNGFPTPTGRMEVYSNVFLAKGANPMFEFEESLESPYSEPEMYKEYPLIATSGRRYPNFFHSAYRGVPNLRELSPHPMATLSPQEAEKHGLKDGDEIWIESARGRISMQCKISAGLHPRVICIPHGWWQGCKALNLPDYPNDSANVNVLVGNKAVSKDFGSPAMRAFLCRIKKKGA